MQGPLRLFAIQVFTRYMNRDLLNKIWKVFVSRPMPRKQLLPTWKKRTGFILFWFVTKNR
ncbi:MAG: hypothetical protein A1D16_04600 [Flavihumibacter sp. CACIAM 22H1]|nr:MAG: hypothetical protein A1D16_04600 [Flavihumibacter sp. CACIAM 22H1]